MSIDISGKTAIVTGSSAGISQLWARIMAEAGASVALVRSKPSSRPMTKIRAGVGGAAVT